MDDLGREAERARRGAVAAVRAEHDTGLDLLSVDGQRVRPDVRDPDAVAHVGARGRCLLEQKVVEPPALRHQRERSPGPPLEARPVMEPALEAFDAVLDDRLERERKQPRRAERHAAAARLVAREGRAVDEQYAGAGGREAVGGGRPCGAGADDGDVE